MPRFVHINDIQPVVDLANNGYGVNPSTDADEVIEVYDLARANNNAIWNQILTFIDNNPLSTESEIANGTIGSNAANDRRVLILMAILHEIFGLVVDDI